MATQTKRKGVVGVVGSSGGGMGGIIDVVPSGRKLLTVDGNNSIHVPGIQVRPKVVAVRSN